MIDPHHGPRSTKSESKKETFHLYYCRGCPTTLELYTFTYITTVYVLTVDNDKNILLQMYPTIPRVSSARVGVRDWGVRTQRKEEVEVGSARTGTDGTMEKRVPGTIPDTSHSRPVRHSYRSKTTGVFWRPSPLSDVVHLVEVTRLESGRGPDKHPRPSTHPRRTQHSGGPESRSSTPTPVAGNVSKIVLPWKDP